MVPEAPNDTTVANLSRVRIVESQVVDGPLPASAKKVAAHRHAFSGCVLLLQNSLGAIKPY
eukprot:7181856-Lingulodinium_polyedra.AAC.1